MVRSDTQQKTTIELLLKTYNDIKELEDELAANIEDIGGTKNVTELLRDLTKYNTSLNLLLNMVKEALGKSIMPSDITQTIQSGGPVFIKKSKNVMVKNKELSENQFQEFIKLRNETISIWKLIDENVENATAEESVLTSSENISD